MNKLKKIFMLMVTMKAEEYFTMPSDVEKNFDNLFDYLKKKYGIIGDNGELIGVKI